MGELEALLFGGGPRKYEKDRLCRAELHVIPAGKKYCSLCSNDRRKAAKDPSLCLRQKHPIELMKTKPNGNRYCPGCRDDWKKKPDKFTTTDAKVRVSRMLFAKTVPNDDLDPEGMLREIELSCGCRKLFRFNHVPISVLELVWCQRHRECFHPVPISEWRVREGETVVGG